MEAKCLRRNLIFISTICLLEFITPIASTTCPEGQYYFENSMKEENSTTVEDGNNCRYCEYAISMCISCFFNHSKVVCHNCTDGLTSSDGDLCVRVESVPRRGTPTYGVVLIVLTIIILVVGASTFVYFYRKKNHGKGIPPPNVFPDPDGLSKGERSGKVKNKYTRDPTSVASRIEPAYGTQAEERTSGSSMNWKIFGEPRKSMDKTAKVEDVDVENKKVKVRKAEVQDEESHQYENFGVKSGTKIHSQYPKGNNDDVYQNV